MKRTVAKTAIGGKNGQDGKFRCRFFKVRMIHGLVVMADSKKGPVPCVLQECLRARTSTNGPGAAEGRRTGPRVFTRRIRPLFLHLTLRCHWWHSQPAGAGAGAIRNHGGKSDTAWQVAMNGSWSGCCFPSGSGKKCSPDVTGTAVKRKITRNNRKKSPGRYTY